LRACAPRTYWGQKAALALLTQKEILGHRGISSRGRRKAQLDTDLAQGPALGVQVGCTLNVHYATATTLGRIGLPPNQDVGARV
jgi:hypothetical protein